MGDAGWGLDSSMYSWSFFYCGQICVQSIHREVYNLMSFEQRTYPCNHHSQQDREHFYCPRKYPRGPSGPYPRQPLFSLRRCVLPAHEPRPRVIGEWVLVSFWDSPILLPVSVYSSFLLSASLYKSIRLVRSGVSRRSGRAHFLWTCVLFSLEWTRWFRGRKVGCLAFHEASMQSPKRVCHLSSPRVLGVLSHCQQKIGLLSWMLTILIGVSGISLCLCVSVATDDTKQLSMGLSSVCASSSWRVDSSPALCLFLIEFLGFLPYSGYRSSLSDTCMANIFFLSVTCLFMYSTLTFDEQRYF